MTSTINIFDNLQCIIQASQCVHSWMCYLSKASDNNCLLAESSIRYPFVECLERHQVNDVQLEKRHPVFQGKRMDVYIGKKDRNDDDNNISGGICVEFKFVREDASYSKETERYLHDLLRLSCIKKEYPSTRCFFLICGETSLFVNQLQHQINREKIKNVIPETQLGKRIKPSQSICKDWLSFDLKKNKKNVNLASRKYKQYLCNFSEEYLSKIRKGVTPFTIKDMTLKTELRLLLPKHNVNESSYTLGLWEIFC